MVHLPKIRVATFIESISFMMKRSLFHFVIVLSSFLFVFCSNNAGRERNKEEKPEAIEEKLLGANAILIDAEDQEIKDFIQRHGWEMQETGSGLRYMIYEQGSGPQAEKDDTAIFHYSLRLITGDLLYSSDDQEVAEFRIGHGGVESGLDEGMQLLKKGDKARFILPSHLAHGVPGDGAMIPRRATLIYDVELIDLN